MRIWRRTITDSCVITQMDLNAKENILTVIFSISFADNDISVPDEEVTDMKFPK